MAVAIALGCLAGIIFLCAWLTGYVDKVVSWQRKQHDRISTLEVNDYRQDTKLDKHTAQLHMLKRDVKTLGKDVGWGDDLSKTQLAKTQVMPPKDEPPDDAA